MTSRPLPHRHDVLIALGGLVTGLLLWDFGLFNNRPPTSVPTTWTLLPLTVMCLAVLGRRIAQPWVLLLAVPALAGDFLCGSLLPTIVLFSDLVYAAVLYGSARLARVVPPASVAVTVAVTLVLLAVFRDPKVLLLSAVCGGITIAPAWTGTIIRDHRNAAAAERLRAEQTALLAEMDRTQAVNAERTRMARELHDLVANHLSAIAIHSTAAQSLDPESADGRAATGEALGVIRENSVQGLAEMRRLIGLLRDAGGDGGEAPQDASPTLDALDALLARARNSTQNTGLDFHLHDERGPGALPAPVELAAYRVVQEAVTNALKHAAPGTVTVRLAHTAPGAPLIVRVASPLGDGPNEAPRAPGSGAGLIGMRERAELLGGELTAGVADATNCWVVQAELPMDRPAPTGRPAGERGQQQ